MILLAGGDKSTQAEHHQAGERAGPRALGGRRNDSEDHALGVIARAKGMSQLARDTGLARESLYKALSAEGNPEFATVLKVLKALGLRLHASVA